MSSIIKIDTVRRHEIDLSPRDIKVHTIMALPGDELEHAIERLKQIQNRGPWKRFIYRSILTRADRSVTRNIDLKSQSAFGFTIDRAVGDAKEENEHCGVRATAHNPDNHTPFDGFLAPEPSKITIVCNAENCCLNGIEKVSEAISSNLNVSRARFDALMEG